MGDIAALTPVLVNHKGGTQNLGSEQQGCKEGFVIAVHAVGREKVVWRLWGGSEGCCRYGKCKRGMEAMMEADLYLLAGPDAHDHVCGAIGTWKAQRTLNRLT